MINIVIETDNSYSLIKNIFKNSLSFTYFKIILHLGDISFIFAYGKYAPLTKVQNNEND